MDPGTAAWVVTVDVLVAVGWSLLVGWSAPRWPDRWVDRDRWPLGLTRWDRAATYRRWGVTWLIRVLPEGGAWFGGASKASLPGTREDALRAYLREVRRAEWVHVLSMTAWLPLALAAVLQPVRWPEVAGPTRWWIAGAVALAVLLGNLPFLLILRYNRVRLTRIVQRWTIRRTDPPSASAGA